MNHGTTKWNLKAIKSEVCKSPNDNSSNNNTKHLR